MIDNSPKVRIKSNTDYKAAKVSENTGAIFSILTESVYSLPRLAGIREIISNALDASVRGNSDRPILIKSPTTLDPTFSVRDYGVGLLEDEIYDLYTSLGSSSKKEVENEIGFFGIGTLSPLAYVEQFTVQSFKDGILSVYSIFTGEDGVPQVAIITSGPTGEPNGLCVSYAVKRNEINEFNKDIITTLTYIPSEKYKCPAHQIEYYKNTLNKSQSLILNFDDNIFVSRKGWADKNILVMGGVPYEYDVGFLNNKLFQSYVITIEAPIGAVSIQASREKLKMNAKTMAYIKSVVEYVVENIEKEVQKHVDASDNFWEAYQIVQRIIIVQLKGMKWRDKPLEIEYFMTEMSKYFDVKTKLGKLFLLYGSPDYIRKIYSRPQNGHKLILDDTPKGGLVRIQADRKYDSATTACVQRDSDKTEEFIKLFGNIFVDKTSNLPEPPKKVRAQKSKKKSYLINKHSKAYNYTFNNCTLEFKDDFDKFDGYYVVCKNRILIYKDKKISISNLFLARHFTDKDILIIDWETTPPPKAKCFFEYFTQNIEKEVKYAHMDWLYERFSHDRRYNFLLSCRDDFKKNVDKYKCKPTMKRNAIPYGIIGNLDIKINDKIESYSDLYDKIHRKIENTINKNYPLLQYLNYGAYDGDAGKHLKKYLLEGDQNVFDVCFN